MSATLRTDHRPWPMPGRRWTWRQSWCDLLFAHWPVPVDLLRRFVPAPLEIQQFGGTSWIGLVPFRMTGVMRRPLPDMPGISAFHELNVRIYVEHAGKAGVWFLSLEANNPLAVWAARRFFYLPYYRARMSLETRADEIAYASSRPGAELSATYRPTSNVYAARSGTLEHWLTERYCLYAQAADGAIFRNDVHHAPWPLQRAEAEFSRNTLLDWHGVHVSDTPALLHFARRLDVIVWGGERIA